MLHHYDDLTCRLLALIYSPLAAHSRRLASAIPAIIALGILLAPMPIEAITYAQTPTNNPQNATSTPSEESEEYTDNTQDKIPSVVLVEGQVTDPCGAGIEKLSVSLKMKDAESGQYVIIAKAETNALGDFSVSGPNTTKGPAVVELSRNSEKVMSLDVVVGEEEWPPFLAEELLGKISISGVVIDALTQRPIPGAEITFDNACRELNVVCDEKGQFSQDTLLPGRLKASVSSEGYGREIANAQLGHSGTLQPLSKSITLEGKQCKFLLKPERTIVLTVVDDLDKPVAKAVVETYDQKREDFRTLATDEAGKVVIDGLHFDATTLLLRVSHESYVSSLGYDHKVQMAKDEAETPFKVTLARGGAVKGKVLDNETRKPLSGARIAAGEEQSDFAPRDWSDYEGNFSLTGLPPGENVLTIFRVDNAPELIRVQIRAEEETKRTVRLTPSTSVVGTVKREDGTPVEGAEVRTTTWRGLKTLGLRALTDSQGQFIIRDTPHDEFEIVARMRGIESEPLLVQGGQESIVLTVEAPSTDPSKGKLPVGSPAPDFEVITLDGKTIRLSDLKGKTVLLDFWATWCPPCVAELPSLVSIRKKFDSREDFVMISVSLDTNERVLKDAVKKHKLDWPQAWGEKDGAKAAIESYGIRAVPTVFVIDKDGKISAIDLFGERLVDHLTKVFETEKK